MNTASNINLGMDYRTARQHVLAYYAPYTVEHAVAKMTAEDVLAGEGTLDELIDAQIAAWGVNVIGEAGARAFRFAVQFYVLYPEG